MVTVQSITVRRPESIYQARGTIENGTFHGRWHFSFDRYRDPEWVRFGPLRVFNDDTLSPGAVWPLHHHREIEVVTYCVAGEFRHADQNGLGGVLRPGDVQHTTVGTGMSHSEINNLPDVSMRFIQMWFLPERRGLTPSVEQRAVAREERTNRLLLLVSPDDGQALPLRSPAEVRSSFLEAGHTIAYRLADGEGAYLYVIEGGDVRINGTSVPAMGAAKITEGGDLSIEAERDSELLLITVRLDGTQRG